MKNFLAHTDEIREEMLREISCASIEDLFKQIPVKFKDGQSFERNGSTTKGESSCKKK